MAKAQGVNIEPRIDIPIVLDYSNFVELQVGLNKNKLS